ncbi:MAG: hypothetical protein U0900_24220 [Myxococcota bacterium]
MQVDDLDKQSEVERRSSFERFIYVLDGVIEQQIEEIATLDPAANLGSLRRAHYDWKLSRDLKCAEVGRTEPADLKELECRSNLSEEYYQKLEERIAELQSLAGKSGAVP